MSTQTVEATDLDPVTGEPRLAHLIAPKDGKDGVTQIMKARIYGMTVEALCGRQVIPSRDPQQYPNCQRCIEIFKEMTGAEDGFRDA